MQKKLKGGGKLPWRLWNIIFQRKTEAERKRDKYSTLYLNLDEELSTINNTLNEIDYMYSSYKSNIPGFYVHIPTKEYTNAKSSLNKKLKTEIAKYEDLKGDVLSARDKALDQYDYYRKLALTEQNNLNAEDKIVKEKLRR